MELAGKAAIVSQDAESFDGGVVQGSAQYGNIGAEGRLDFTVIGPAVNTASRLEGVCAKLGRRVIASAELALCSGTQLVALGEVDLKGVTGRTPVFGVPEDATTP